MSGRAGLASIMLQRPRAALTGVVQIRLVRLGCRGAVALEFALIAAMFLGIVGFLADLGFVLYTQMALDFVASRSAHQLAVDSQQRLSSSPGPFQALTVCPLLYTTYIPLGSNGFYNANVAPFIGQVAPNLRACASSGNFAFQASDPAAIAGALQAMLKAAVSAPARFTH